jgi:FkbM family methyltransferase
MPKFAKKAAKRFLVVTYKIGIRFLGGKGLSKTWPLGAIHEWISDRARNYNKPEYVKFRSHVIYLDSYDNAGLSVWGENNRLAEIELEEKCIRPGFTVLDIGANIGFFSLIYAKGVGSEGRVFSFEPGPENVAILRKNIEANGYTNVEIIPKAVSDTSRSVDLYLSDYNVGDHRIYDPYEKTKDWGKTSAAYEKLAHRDRRESVSVETVVLDDFFAGRESPIDFVKIDVQGAEGGVVNGMRRILTENKNVVVFSEFWPAGMAMYGFPAKNFLAFFKDFGFEMYEVDEKKGFQSIPATSDMLLEKYTVENNKSCDLLFKRPL